jgi:hypothetical protein
MSENTDADAVGKPKTTSITIDELSTLEVAIKGGWKGSELGRIDGHLLYMRSKMFSTMLQESKVEKNVVTFEVPDVQQSDVKALGKMLTDKEYFKIMTDNSVFDDFRNQFQTPTELQMDLSGSALSIGLLKLIDFFELDILKDRIVELTNKHPTLERILSLNAADHATPWMHDSAANIVMERLAGVTLNEKKGLYDLATDADCIEEMAKIRDDLDAMAFDNQTLRHVASMLAYTLQHALKDHPITTGRKIPAAHGGHHVIASGWRGEPAMLSRRPR